MPRRRYDDEGLRRRALELRRRSYSYREIARELGCSLYKVWEILSPVESPRSRLRQAAELVARIEELSGRLHRVPEELDRVEGRLRELVKAAGKAGLLEELSREVSGLREKLLSLMEELKEYDDSLIDIYTDLALIAEAGRLRMGRCKYYRDGYCHRWYWTERHPELDDGEVKRALLKL